MHYLTHSIHFQVQGSLVLCLLPLQARYYYFHTNAKFVFWVKQLWNASKRLLLCYLSMAHSSSGAMSVIFEKKLTWNGRAILTEWQHLPAGEVANLLMNSDSSGEKHTGCLLDEGKDFKWWKMCMFPWWKMCMFVCLHVCLSGHFEKYHAVFYTNTNLMSMGKK